MRGRASRQVGVRAAEIDRGIAIEADGSVAVVGIAGRRGSPAVSGRLQVSGRRALSGRLAVRCGRGRR